MKYPGTSKNIVELDMVQNIRIEGEKVVVYGLVFQKASDPFVGSVKKKAEALIKKNFLYGGRDRKPVVLGFGETVSPWKR